MGGHMGFHRAHWRAEPVRRPTAIVLALLLCGINILAGVQDSFQLKVEVQAIPVNVLVDDATGKPITNLVREDFTVLEDGQQREIQSFESAETPYNILLLFDRSSST